MVYTAVAAVTGGRCTEQRKTEEGRRVVRRAAGRIKTPGAGEVFLSEPADSDPSWTAELACHGSTSGKYISFFSLCC